MNKKLKTLSSWLLALSALVLIAAYCCFHYLTDGGFTLVWQPEAGKPFVTELLGDLGVLFLFGGIVSRLCARIFYPEERGRK